MSEQGPGMSTRVLRIAFGVLLAATCLRVWTGPPAWETSAQAQIPNAGAQRADLLGEVRRTNQLLEEVLGILRSKTIKVEVQGESGREAAPIRPAPRGSTAAP